MGQRNQALPQNVHSGPKLPGFSLMVRRNETGMEVWNPEETHWLVSLCEETPSPLRQAGLPTFPGMSQIVYTDPELSV